MRGTVIQCSTPSGTVSWNHESRDVTWLHRIYYERLDTDVTGLDLLVVIEADYPRNKVVEQRVKIEKAKDDNKDDESIRFEVSKASSSLKAGSAQVRQVCASDHNLQFHNWQGHRA